MEFAWEKVRKTLEAICKALRDEKRRTNEFEAVCVVQRETDIVFGVGR